MARLMPLAFLVLLAACSSEPPPAIAVHERVPVLHFRHVDGKTVAYKGDGKTALNEWKDIKAHLRAYSDLYDPVRGWEGRNRMGISGNLLVVHADADAHADTILSVLNHARSELKFGKLAIAVTEHLKPTLAETPAEAKAPDAATLGDEYLVADLYTHPTDMPVPGPEEIITLYAHDHPDAAGASFEVALFARGRKAVDNSLGTQENVTLRREDHPATRKEKDQLRKQIHDSIVEAVERATVRFGALIEKAELAATPSTAWVFLELGWQALNKVNANRAAAGKPALTLILPFQYQVAEPPPPGRAPGEEMEFPTEEPVQPNPTEDERIIEDAEQEIGEDPADKPIDGPNEDLNYYPDVGELPQPRREPSGVGLAGSGPGRGVAPGFAHRRTFKNNWPHADRTIAALEWLKDHQSEEGFWSATAFGTDSKRKAAKATGNVEFTDKVEADTGWESVADFGLTGLALMAFAGNGWHHKSGDYRATCRQAVLFLRRVQDNDGCFGPKEDDCYVYNHAIATLAIAEIYGLSGDVVLRPILDKAVEFIMKAQNPGLGWRYGVRPGTNDTSVTSWMVKALYAAKLAGIEADYDKAFGDAKLWYEFVTTFDGIYPDVGYDSPARAGARLRSATGYDDNLSMEALYIKCMLIMGKADLKDSTIKSLAEACTLAENLPKWKAGRHESIDFYYWYAGSLAMYQMERAHWEKWQRACNKAMLDHQRGWHEADKRAELTSHTTLDEHGSWDAVDAWSTAGGRVYATALGALSCKPPSATSASATSKPGRQRPYSPARECRVGPWVAAPCRPQTRNKRPTRGWFGVRQPGLQSPGLQRADVRAQSKGPALAGRADDD